MPRPARRALLPEAPVTIHFIWRCHNREFLLDDDAVKELYLQLIADHKERYGIEVYGYALMSNHVHAVLRLPARSSWQCFARTVNSKLASHINRANGRRGQVVMDRPRTIVLERDEDVLAAIRYIELNPVRAGLARRPRDFRWSSYRRHALGRADRVVDTCPALEALGNDERARRRGYAALFSLVRAALDLRRRRDLVDVYFVGSLLWQQHHLRALGASVRCGERAPPS